MSTLLRSEVNQYNQDLSRIRHVLTETAELFEDIEAATRISGGEICSESSYYTVIFLAHTSMLPLLFSCIDVLFSSYFCCVFESVILSPL